jgi:hypothetical protein
MDRLFGIINDNKRSMAAGAGSLLMRLVDDQEPSALCVIHGTKRAWCSCGTLTFDIRQMTSAAPPTSCARPWRPHIWGAVRRYVGLPVIGHSGPGLRACYALLSMAALVRINR